VLARQNYDPGRTSCTQYEERMLSGRHDGKTHKSRLKYEIKDDMH